LGNLLDHVGFSHILFAPHLASMNSSAKPKRLKTVLKFTITGTVIGLLMGGLFSLVSGNVFVILFVGSLVTVVGLILGIIHRNDAE